MMMMMMFMMVVMLMIMKMMMMMTEWVVWMHTDDCFISTRYMMVVLAYWAVLKVITVAYAKKKCKTLQITST